MLDDLYKIVKSYLKQRTSFENGCIGNPFYVDNKQILWERYFLGIVSKSHDPNVLRRYYTKALGEMIDSMEFAREVYYGQSKLRVPYLKAIFEIDKATALQLLMSLKHNFKCDKFLIDTVVENCKNDSDAYRIISKLGISYCYLIKFNAVEFMFSEMVNEEILLLLRYRSNLNTYIAHLAGSFDGICKCDCKCVSELLISMIKDLEYDRTSIFRNIHKMVNYIKQYGSRDVVDFFINHISSILSARVIED
jgi:hypothetical protein